MAVLRSQNISLINWCSRHSFTGSKWHVQTSSWVLLKTKYFVSSPGARPRAAAPVAYPYGRLCPGSPHNEAEGRFGSPIFLLSFQKVFGNSTSTPSHNSSIYFYIFFFFARVSWSDAFSVHVYSKRWNVYRASIFRRPASKSVSRADSAGERYRERHATPPLGCRVARDVCEAYVLGTDGVGWRGETFLGCSSSQQARWQLLTGAEGKTFAFRSTPLNPSTWFLK